MIIAELIKGCQQGDAKSQRFLFEKYADGLFRIAVRYIRDSSSAEDIVMQSFMKIFSHIHTFEMRDGATLEAWMKKITVNEALMALRKNSNFNLVESIDDHPQVVDDTWIEFVGGEYLLQLIVELPAGYRTVFNLFVVEGYTHEEIATMLRISPNTSRSQLFKAKSLLKKKIEKENRVYGT